MLTIHSFSFSNLYVCITSESCLPGIYYLGYPQKNLYRTSVQQPICLLLKVSIRKEHREFVVVIEARVYSKPKQQIASCQFKLCLLNAYCAKKNVCFLELVGIIYWITQQCCALNFLLYFCCQKAQKEFWRSTAVIFLTQHFCAILSTPLFSCPPNLHSLSWLLLFYLCSYGFIQF